MINIAFFDISAKLRKLGVMAYHSKIQCGSPRLHFSFKYISIYASCDWSAFRTRLLPKSCGKGISPAPLVPPDVAIVKIGGYYVLRFTFHTCNVECNTWTLVYWQADDVPYADGTKTRVAVLNCSSPFPQSFDYRIYPIVLAASGEPAFDYWYGILDCNYN